MNRAVAAEQRPTDGQRLLGFAERQRQAADARVVTSNADGYVPAGQQARQAAPESLGKLQRLLRGWRRAARQRDRQPVLLLAQQCARRQS